MRAKKWEVTETHRGPKPGDDRHWAFEKGQVVEFDTPVEWDNPYVVPFGDLIAPSEQVDEDPPSDWIKKTLLEDYGIKVSPNIGRQTLISKWKKIIQAEAKDGTYGDE